MLSAAIGLTPVPTPRVHAAEGDISDTELQAAITRATTARTEGESEATVAVEVLTSDDAAIERTVRELGGVVTGSVDGEVVQALVPASQVRTLADADEAEYVQAPRSAGYLPDTLRRTEAGVGTGPTVGDEVTITNADAWHTADHLGTGVHVGIIDYFDMQLWNIAEHGPKPTVGNGRMFCQDSLNIGLCTISGGIVDIPDGLHGVAVAEVVKDMAPAADLYIATVGTVSDLRAAVDWFAANGVAIITRSLGSAYDGPGDGTGPLDSVVDYAVGKKITWFNSAGNDAVDNYMTRSVPTSLAANGYVDFDSGPGTDNWLRLDGGSILMDGVRWANDWYLPTAQKTDYSVEFWEPTAAVAANLSDQHWNPSNTTTHLDPIDVDGNNTNAVNNITDASQRTGAPPLEAADLLVNPVNSYGLGGVTFIRVKRNSTTTVGSVADTLEIALGRGLTEVGYSNKPGSAAKPAVDSKSPGMLAVGAIEPAAGSVIASYSSRGPTTDGRIKPDISAPSGLASTIYSPSSFSGTSAAAPTAAGVAALLLGAGLAAPASLPALVRHLAATYGDLGTTGPDNLYGAGEFLLPDPPAIAPSDRSRYVPLTVPARALDTRTTSHVGPAELVGPYAAQAIIEMPMLGAGGVPASDVTAVAINLTSVGSTVSGYVQAAPFLVGAIGGTSTLNIVAGTVRPNFAVVPLGVDGKISIFIQSGGNVVVDVLGYYVDNPGTATEGRFVPLTTPERWMDTRGKPGVPMPATFGGTPRRLNPLERVIVPMPGSSTVDLADVDALVVTLTAVDGLAGGYLRAMPTGTLSPTHSNVNFVAGTGVANTSIVPLADDGTIELQANIAVNAIVDVVGYITSATAADVTFGLFKPITPGRAVDTRLPAPNPIAGGSTRTFPLTGLTTPVVDPAAVGVSVNATAVFPVAAGWLKVYPGPTEPPTSNVNYLANDVVATGTFVRLNAGAVIAKMFQTGHVIIDVNGYFLP